MKLGDKSQKGKKKKKKRFGFLSLELALSTKFTDGKMAVERLRLSQSNTWKKRSVELYLDCTCEDGRWLQEGACA